MVDLSAFYVAIDNLGEIGSVFGGDVAREVHAEVGRRLGSDLRLDYKMKPIKSLGFALSARRVADVECHHATKVAMALQSATAYPITIGNLSVAVSLSCRQHQCEKHDIHQGCGHVSRQAYLADMGAATFAYLALSEGRFYLEEQPIHRAGSQGVYLYKECLIRLCDERERAVMPALYIPALERLGLTRAFDRQIVSVVIEELKQRRDVVLGCNVSARSVSLDLWWQEQFPLLLKASGVSGRLIVELTESAQPYSFEVVARFVSHLQKAGCRVALDDFGTGYSSFGLAADVVFDIIKIDRSYLRRRGPAEDAGFLLPNLITIARSMARDVVVEGVETETDLAAARLAGAHWVQGYFIGRPEVSMNHRGQDIVSLEMNDFVQTAAVQAGE
ncbi:EAL domain-containing protein [Dongia sedimenti]|uniref:EAL domain-containing protein n=1 Tax=Dongia sedimenti TaxID=3064282 RepID=A0ABU0YRR4_9PROT|nr:EAL domain-containing protein [Rhodospirillaceae bacterium R-7]